MASIFTHSLVGGTLAYLAPAQLQNHPKAKWFYFLMIFLPIIPDFDYVGFVFRVPYNSFWGHRGFTHSILFAFICTTLLCFYLSYKKNLKPISQVYLFLFLALISHAVLDAMTNGGLGVAFYSPYTLTRYFFSWRPIQVSPLGMHFFSERGLVVLTSEFFWIWIPCLFLIFARRLLK